MDFELVRRAGGILGRRSAARERALQDLNLNARFAHTEGTLSMPVKMDLQSPNAAAAVS
jgi:hypothetical protein